MAESWPEVRCPGVNCSAADWPVADWPESRLSVRRTALRPAAVPPRAPAVSDRRAWPPQTPLRPAPAIRGPAHACSFGALSGYAQTGISLGACRESWLTTHCDPPGGYTGVVSSTQVAERARPVPETHRRARRRLLLLLAGCAAAL